MKVRVGFGYDVHKLAEGRPFILGGVTIHESFGPVGHSDADVLIHAICDAILGAANMRDIGYHFPDTDPQYKGVDSTILLRDVMQLVRQKGYELGNIDCTVCLEQPKVNPHIEAIMARLADVMTVDQDDISIKATTSERMGFVGRGDGVAAYCVALLSS